jgi:hypothetical protein
MSLLLDSFIFWLIITTLICCCLYIIKEYIRLKDYEGRINRGWDDMINRSDRVISRLEEIEYLLNQKQSDKKIGKPKTK